jgi:hypothetical protein
VFKKLRKSQSLPNFVKVQNFDKVIAAASLKIKTENYRTRNQSCIRYLAYSGGKFVK